jgi:hypothetical protein
VYQTFAIIYTDLVDTTAALYIARRHYLHKPARSGLATSGLMLKGKGLVELGYHSVGPAVVPDATCSFCDALDGYVFQATITTPNFRVPTTVQYSMIIENGIIRDDASHMSCHLTTRGRCTTGRVQRGYT